jgi:hypothetical protein
MIGADILQETIQKYKIEIFNTDHEVNNQWGSHQCIIKQWIKKFLWTVKDSLNTFYWKIMEDSNQMPPNL